MEHKKFKDMYDRLNIITISKKDYNKIIKDRLDFGFDSIYFRYAEICDELAAYKSRVHGTQADVEQRAMWARKQHFYDALEQLLMAHQKDEKDDIV